jgi:hypothetical protein
MRQLPTLVTAFLVFAICVSGGTRSVLLWNKKDAEFATYAALRDQASALPPGGDAQWEKSKEATAVFQQSQQTSQDFIWLMKLITAQAVSILWYLCIRADEKRYMRLVALITSLLLAILIWL